MSADILKSYVGTYDFGPSLSSHDKQAPLVFVGTGLTVSIVEDKVEVLRAHRRRASRARRCEGARRHHRDRRHGDARARLNEVLDKLRGKVGTPVRLKISRYLEDRPIDVTIVRESIRVPGARIQVRLEDGKLTVAATGEWAVLDFEKGKPVPVIATSDTEFRHEGGDHTRLAFVRDAAGKVSGVVLNSGPWEIKAAKVD